MIKLGKHNDYRETNNRILFGPHHKIGRNLLYLVTKEDKYKVFLPELPLLHLHKSKINNLFSAYRDAGLIQLVRYMKDDNQTE